MHLFALVIIICNLHTSECESFATALYEKSNDCEVAASYMRDHPTPGVLMIYCTNTTEPTRPKRSKSR